jgi:hypothetical protein
MRLIIAIVLLLLGLALPLLLNGQTFTNSLVGIGCAGIAVPLALWAARDPRADGARPRAGLMLAGLGILLVAAILAQLPSAYRVQDGFNRERERLRQRGQGHRAGAADKSFVPPASPGATAP